VRSYEELVAEALAAPFEVWDFSWWQGRTRQAEPMWSYEGRALQLIAGATSLLDVCTGGGELLASLAPLPAHTVAGCGPSTRRSGPTGRCGSTTTATWWRPASRCDQPAPSYGVRGPSENRAR
jgi:hypothetical protein